MRACVCLHIPAHMPRARARARTHTRTHARTHANAHAHILFLQTVPKLFSALKHNRAPNWSSNILQIKLKSNLITSLKALVSIGETGAGYHTRLIIKMLIQLVHSRKISYFENLLFNLLFYRLLI